MIKCIGSAELPGVYLRYYVFGNRRSGYGIRIAKANEECTQYVSKNLLKVLDLARKLRRCTVFPYNLREIIDDLQFPADPN